MKSNKTELDVDFIGGAGPLTKEEEKAIIAFLNSKRAKTSKKRSAQHNRLAKNGGRLKQKSH